MMLNVAFLGNGKSANRYHIPFLLTRPDKFKIKKIWSRSGRMTWKQIEGVVYTQDIQDIWQDETLDLVIITTPGASHFELAKEALEHGKHLVVEKPFVETYDQARELFELATSKGLFLQCYQNRRFDSDFLTMQKVIESGKLGQIQEVEMHYDYYRPETPLNSSYSKIDSFLYGHGAHTVDQAVSYFGQPCEIRFDVRQLLGPDKMNDYFDLDFFYESGLKLSIKASYFRVKSRPSFVVYGQKGVFIKQTEDRQEEHLKLFYMPGSEGFGLDRPQDYGLIAYYDDLGQYHEEKVRSEVGDYARYYDAVYDSLVHGKEKLVQDDQTLFVMSVLENGINQI